MKALRRNLVILVLTLGIAFPVFAQDTEIPKPTEIVTVEATVEPLPAVEPAPTETVDEINWVDDVLEAFSKIDVATVTLAIGFLALLLQIRKPQTSEEKRLRDEELARKETDARITPSQIDDLFILVSRLANSLRPVQDVITPATVGIVASRTPLTTISGTPDAIVTTTTIVDSPNVETKG